MEVLIIKDDENIIRNISVSGVSEVLGSEKYTQRVIENGKGRERKIKLYDGEEITVKGTFIIVHEEYGAYRNITLDDMGVAMLAVEG